MSVEIGTVAAQFLSGNICFEFSVLVLCSALSTSETLSYSLCFFLTPCPPVSVWQPVIFLHLTYTLSHHLHLTPTHPELLSTSALQRQNTEFSKQIFPEKEYRGLSPNFHIHASVCYLYIPTIGLPILLEEICKAILGVWYYINRSQRHECWNWGWGRAFPRKGIHKWYFLCSVWDNLFYFLHSPPVDI
jgi:hypothetical protein